MGVQDKRKGVMQWISNGQGLMGCNGIRVENGVIGGQYDPTEYNMGAAASARLHTVLDSSGTRTKKKKKNAYMLPSPLTHG